MGNDERYSCICRIFDHFNPRSRVGNDHRRNLSGFQYHISIHVPAWGTTGSERGFSGGCNYFNPRSRVGNDTTNYPKQSIDSIISIHVPAWGTTRRWDVFMTMHVISIHVPAWGTTDGQNDRPGDGRSISIHVPAWGTTNIHVRRIPCCCISIHVPAWGTTTEGTYQDSNTTFQSTFPRGERQGRNGAFPADVIISIHVPAWGTTPQIIQNSPLIQSFQSTFPRGERRIRCMVRSVLCNFNPRSRVGNDSA